MVSLPEHPLIDFIIQENLMKPTLYLPAFLL